MTTDALSQTTEREKLQTMVTSDAAIRLRVAAAITGKNIGQVISELAAEHLDAVPVKSSIHAQSD